MGQKQLLQFQLTDADGDGKLTVEEVRMARQSLISRHERNETMKDYEKLLRFRMKKETWFETADTDKDGLLTFEEFKFKTPEKKPALDLQQRQEAQFKLVDADGDGELTVDEVAVAKEALTAKK